MNKKIVLPISGGMDSSVLLYHAINKYEEIHTLSFDYSQRHKKELIFATKQVEEARRRYPNKLITHKVLDISFIKDIATTSALTNLGINVAKIKDVCGHPQHQNYVPFRNMILLSIACSYAESVDAQTIYHGAAQIDSAAGFWDGSVEFLDVINSITALNRMKKIQIVAPLIDMSKKDIILHGVNLGVDFNKTWTCYEGLEDACGECTSCSARIKGFIDAKIKDPITYSRTIPWEKFI